MLEVGPMASTVPNFPLASSAVGPLRAKSEQTGSRDFMNLWSGQAARLAHRNVPAGGGSSGCYPELWHLGRDRWSRLSRPKRARNIVKDFRVEGDVALAAE
jgi:hypothetical protein